jgi:hypothetical protein
MLDVQLTSILMYMNIVLVSFYILLLYWAVAAGRRWFVSATSWFLFWQLLLLIGTLVNIDLHSAVDLQWLFVIIGGMFLFTIGVIAANSYHHFKPRQEIYDFVNAPVEMDPINDRIMPMLLLVGIVSLAVGVIFVQAIGYNVFTWAVMNYISNEGLIDRAEYSQLRTSISQERYVAAGYASQFIVILLPLVIYLLYYRVRQKMHWGTIIVLVMLTLADIYFLTIKGGRAWLLNAMLAFYLLGSPFGPLPKSWRLTTRTTVFVFFGFALFYSVSTTLMGRIANTTSVVSFGVVGDLISRTITAEALGHLLIMRYLLPEGAVWGREWWAGLLTVLPGNALNSSFGSELHGFLYGGNTRGSLGLTVWGSLVYNWGTVGSLVLAFIVGFCMQCFTIMYVRGTRSMSRLIVLFVAGLHLARFRDPYSLMLNGFVTVLVFYVLIKFIDSISSASVTAAKVAPQNAEASSG